MKIPQPTLAKPAAASASSLTRVRNPLLQRKCACGGTSWPTGECGECRKKRESGMLQRKVTHLSLFIPHPSEVPPIVHEVLRSPGQPLDTETRAFFEPRFGHNFSHVRVHADQQAVESARAVNALAYTVGRDVVFGAGQYSPHRNRGQKLLAHELAHIVQQTATPNSITTSSGSLSLAEAEADRQGEAVAGPQVAPVALGVSRGAVQFKVDTEALQTQQVQTQQITMPACKCNPPILKGEDCASKGGKDKVVMAAFNAAGGWLPKAQQQIDDFISNPASRSGSKASSALQSHFAVSAGSADELAVARQVSGVIKRTLTNITDPICSHCPDQCGSQDNDAKIIAAISPNAWRNTNCYTFCPLFFNLTAQHPKIAIHEMMHSWERMGDAAYENQGAPAYPPATPVAKVTADCYASLIRDLG